MDAAMLARSRSLEEVAALIWTGRLDADACGYISRTYRITESGRSFRRPAPNRCWPPPRRAIHWPWIFEPTSVALTGLADPAAPVEGCHEVGSGRRHGRRRPHPGVEYRRSRCGCGTRSSCLVRRPRIERLLLHGAMCGVGGVHPYAVVIAGLAALEGPKHGGASARVESMLESMRQACPLRGAVGACAPRRINRRLWASAVPDGDPRARLLLDLLGERYAKSAEYRFVREFAQRGDDHDRRTSEPSTLDWPPRARVLIYRQGVTT